MASKGQGIQLDKEFYPNLIKITNFEGKLSKNEIDTYKTAFIFYDRTGSQYIPRNTLADALRSLGFVIGTLEVREICQKLDKDNSKKLDFNDFLTSCFYAKQNQNSMEQLQEALDTIEKKAQMDYGFLQQVLTSIGDILTEKEVQQIFCGCQVDKEGKIDKQQVIDALTKIKQY